jgi:DNA helicase-2/ATP-dependent DNA helicase PcrA
MTYTPVGTQIDVITGTAPVLVVLGGAGTGKTVTAAAAAAARLTACDQQRQDIRRAAIMTNGQKPLPPLARVLFLSFSRTAVAQVIDRASNVVGPLMNRIEVSTFDGFAWRVINDFGTHYGYPPPLTILGRANEKVPGAPAGLTYDQLIPTATTILHRPAVASHYNNRFSLVICDEFQDTSDTEWAFLQLIAPDERRILLGDLNQCIYADLKNIDPEARIRDALALPGAQPVDLPAANHRDPTGVLPAAAEAARARHFGDDAIRTAVVDGRLTVTRTSPASSHAEVVRLTGAARGARRSVSIFTHTNLATVALSDALTAAGLRHEQVGFTEAYGEALNAQLALLRYALVGEAGARRALAVYVAANSRASSLPPLVTQILNRSNPAFERALTPVIDALRAAAGPPADLGRLADVIAGAYSRVGTLRGQETWSQASRRMTAAIRLLANGSDISAVVAEIEQARHAALVGNFSARPRAVQVMNLHQTKGREADVTILLLQPDEFHGHEREPYPRASRLLYVVLTRARYEAHLVVPPQAHGLWQPLIQACERFGHMTDA